MRNQKRMVDCEEAATQATRQSHLGSAGRKRKKEKEK